MKSSKKRKSKTGTYRKERGAVTIFLIIVLVPCIALSSICVDLSRVELSKTAAVSSADLALNTLMTNYDGDLNDWYGMIGSCQEINTYYSTAEGYFARAMTSKGLSDNELLLLSDVISGRMDSDQIYDLLQVEIVNPVKITEVAGANLANPTLIKDQVVEFMKYRAPIELTKGIIERVKKDSSLDAALEADENEPLVTAKKEFYEAEGELLKGAYRTYLAIKNYLNRVDEVSLTNEKLKGYADQLDGHRDVYRAVHDISVSNLLNTDKLTGTYKRKIIDINQYYRYDLDSMSHVYSDMEEDEEEGTVTYYIKESRLKKLVEEAEEDIRAFDNAKAAYENAVASIMSTPPGSNDVNEIQWWVRMHKAVYLTSGDLHSKLSSAADAMMEHIRTLNAALDCDPDTKSPPSSETYSRCNTALSQIQSRHSSYLSSSASSSDPYVNAANTFAQVSAANIKNIKSNLVTISANGTSMTVDNAIKSTGDTLSSIYDELVSVRNLLDIAIDGDGDKTPSLGDLADMAEKYSDGLDNYEQEADDSTTNMGESEREEIEKNKTEKEINENVTREAVEELETRLSNIRSQLNQLIKAIEDMKYGGTSLKDIKTFSKFREAALTEINVDEIPLKNAQINSLKTSSFSSLFKPEGQIIDLKNTTGNSHNPRMNLEPADPAATDTPDLLVYMHKKFRDSDVNKVDEKEQEQQDAKDKGSDAEAAAKDKDRYNGKGENLKETHSSGKEVSYLSGAWGALVEVIEILMDISKITNIRDDLYVTSYIMEMFSYATFEEEGMYALVENKTELRLPDGDAHAPKEYEAVLGAADQPKTWLSESVEDPYNKTLTNKMINSTNNHAYSAEVEYILKGSFDNAANVKAVYTDIYGIRYALNLVSGFQHFFAAGKNATATALGMIANGIASVTMGIIPPPVTKAIIIPILAIFETCKDMDRLQAGFPVELYKVKASDWWIGIPDRETSSKTEIIGSETSLSDFLDACLGGKSNPDKGIFYSDYVTMFVYLGLKSENKADIYLRIADVIEANMKKVTGSAYDLENTKMYFSLNATLRVKPMMVALPYYFDDYDNRMMTTNDWCTYKVNVVRGYS